MFGVVFYLSGIVPTVSASVIFAFRIVLTLVFYVCVLTVPAARTEASRVFAVLAAHPKKIVVLVVTSLLVGVQLWLFGWAPRSGHALDSAMGFLLMPIVLVLSGRLIFKDSVRPLQWLAVVLASVATITSLVFGGALSWLTFVVCLGYPVYFIIRRASKLDGPAVFGAEVLLLAPLAAILVSSASFKFDSIPNTALLVALGIAGAIAMGLYLNSAQLLPLPLFGLLGYIEPLLLVLVAITLGQVPQIADLWTYLLLFFALVLVAFDGFVTARKSTPRKR